MESLLESLKDYFESTPKEVLDNDWKAVEYLNDIGPDVMEYVGVWKRLQWYGGLHQNSPWKTKF